MWTALYLPNDKCSFSHKAGLKEGGRGEIERGRKREGFPRHLGDLGGETLKQHSLNHTARYHQGSLFVYVCVCVCVCVCGKIKIRSWCVFMWTQLPHCLFVSVWVCVCQCVHVHIFASVFMLICVCNSVYVSIWRWCNVHDCLYVCVLVCECVCVCVCHPLPAAS